MIRIREFIKKPIRWPVVGIALVMALVMVLGTVSALAVDPRPCPDPADPPASDAIVIANIVTKYAAAMGNDTTPADLNTWNPQPLPGDSGGVLWDYFPSDQASGTGVFNTYLAVQAPGNDPLHERGYNTALKPAKCSEYDEGDSKTSALPLSAVPKVTINGTIYREFSCDINEVSGIPDQYVSLEVLQIWQSNSSNLCGAYDMSPDYKFTPVQRLVYDLDCAKDYTLILDYGVNTGSGKPDYKVFIPNSWFDQTLAYVVMVVDHGNLEFVNYVKGETYPYMGFGCSDGFEEWGVRVVEPTCCLDITKGSINACYPDVASAEAAALAATNVTDDCSATAPTVGVSTVGTCNAVITVTATDSCDNSLNVTYNTAIYSPINLTVPGNYTGTACMSQSALDTAWAAFIGGGSFTGGCGGVLNHTNPTKPNRCGGYAEVTWTVTSLCENVTATRSFTVPAAPAVVSNLITNDGIGSCESQAAVDAAYLAWHSALNFSGGCNRVDDIVKPAAPDHCGGNATVTWNITSDCDDPIVGSATFTVADAPALSLNVPGNFTAPTCYANQTEVDEAFAAWVASANVTGGCNPILTDDHGTAPSRCGGNATVTWNVTSDCENVTKSATFIIPPGCCVSCGTACAADGSAGNHTFPNADNWFTYIIYNKGDGTVASPKEYPIFAGQDQLVGTLYVYNNATRLFVRYCADAGPGVGITSYHLEVVDEFSGFNGIRTKHKGVYKNPIPGQCEYKGGGSGMPTCTDWIVSTKDDISKYGDDDIYIFAHSIMCWSQD